MKIGIVSGYFNPLHYGHIEYINGARALCDKLIVIVNNDKQVELKGSKKFMDEIHRYKIVENLKSVDQVFLSVDVDKTVCHSIIELSKSYRSSQYHLMFINSGDRTTESFESTETVLCKELGIETIYIPLPKIYSSSELKNRL